MTLQWLPKIFPMETLFLLQNQLHLSHFFRDLYYKDIIAVLHLIETQLFATQAHLQAQWDNLNWVSYRKGTEDFMQINWNCTMKPLVNCLLCFLQKVKILKINSILIFSGFIQLFLNVTAVDLDECGTDYFKWFRTKFKIYIPRISDCKETEAKEMWN